MFNPDSLQTESDDYWQVVRKGDMHAFDNLPREIRNWMNEEFSHSPAEDILYDFRYKFNQDISATLSHYKGLNVEIANMIGSDKCLTMNSNRDTLIAMV